MILENNPATQALHDDWRIRIKKEFSKYDLGKKVNFLSAIHYIDNAPQKFYSKEAFQKYFQFLNEIKLKDPLVLAGILKDCTSLLSIANRILTEINQEHIHDTLFPTGDIDNINFIDKKIHYNLLKLYETPLYQLSYILAKYSWFKKKKGTDGLDLSNSIKELISIGFTFLEPVYLHSVRNGIAHGKIVFTSRDVTYFDKKANKQTLPTRRIIETFDKAVDVANGFCLAFKVFCFMNEEYFEKYDIAIPHSVLIEELQSKANGPAWKITNCLESSTIGNKSQLMIYAKNDHWDTVKVMWYCVSTVYIAEKLTKSYDRFFFSLHSKNNQISPTGWAGYDAVKIRALIEKNDTNIENYALTLEGNLLYFLPKIKFPGFIYKLGTYSSISKVMFPIIWKNYIDTYFSSPFIVRDTKMHSKRSYAVVEDPSVIIKEDFRKDIENLVRTNRKRIVSLAISQLTGK